MRKKISPCHHDTITHGAHKRESWRDHHSYKISKISSDALPLRPKIYVLFFSFLFFFLPTRVNKRCDAGYFGPLRGDPYYWKRLKRKLVSGRSCFGVWGSSFFHSLYARVSLILVTRNSFFNLLIMKWLYGRVLEVDTFITGADLHRAKRKLGIGKDKRENVW